MSNLVKSFNQYISKLNARLRRYVGGDNKIAKAFNDNSYSNNPEFRYKGFSCTSIHFYFYKEEYIGTVKAPYNNGFCYATGLTLADLFADFVNKVDTHIKENTSCEKSN